MRATAAPLASIFGSGFLVIVPILAGAAGPYAWLAMLCVCGLAYAVGRVIRFNARKSALSGWQRPWGDHAFCGSGGLSRLHAPSNLNKGDV